MARTFCVSPRRTPDDWSEWVALVAAALHSRTRWRLPLVLLGVLFAKGRRTVTTWLRAAGLQRDFADYYYFIGSLGRKTRSVATVLFQLLLAQLPLGDRIVLALDDTPTRRYGPQVEGAGLHHNPTSAPDNRQWVYGHIWVTLAWVVRHPLWHTIALPLRALLYIKAKDVPKLPARYGWKFQTKLEQAGELLEWAAEILRPLGKPIWLVVDGAYACRKLIRRVRAARVTLVSRLRKDAGLRSVPLPRRPGQRGGPRKYGKEKISLAKRAAHPRGWQTIEVELYGKTVTKTYKTFLATYEVVGGLLRVVLVREPDGWKAFFCTDPDASVAAILEAVADRSAIEQVFHDVKEVWGTGQQQVRNLWANLGCFHLNLWMHTLVELWAWRRPAAELRDRSASPWDRVERRPSHADRRKALRHACLQNELSAALENHRIGRPLINVLKSLTQLAA